MEKLKKKINSMDVILIRLGKILRYDSSNDTSSDILHSLDVENQVKVQVEALIKSEMIEPLNLQLVSFDVGPEGAQLLRPSSKPGLVDGTQILEEVPVELEGQPIRQRWCSVSHESWWRVVHDQNR